MDELGNGIAREESIGVERDDDLVQCVRDAEVERARLAAIRLREHADPLVLAVFSSRLLVRAVRRPVIDDDDFQRARVLLRQETVDRTADDLLLVECRDDGTHRGSERGRQRSILVAFEALNEGQRPNHDQPADAQHHGDRENPEEQPFDDAKEAEAADEEQALHAGRRA